jgi:hypothetical protein
MQSLSNLSITEFKIALTPERVRVGMIIQGALAAGALLFFFVILAVASLNHRNNSIEIDLNQLIYMTSACLLFFIVDFVIGYFLYHSQFKPERLEVAYSSDLKDQNGNIIPASPAEKAVSLIRTSMLIRTAMFEGAAFFGLATLLIGAQQGALNTVPWVWINVLPLFVLLIWVMITFPTANRLENIFEANILKR